MGLCYESSSVVVTGASRGIGRSIATVFAEKTSHPLILLARSNDGLQATKAQCEWAGAPDVITIPIDLTEPEAVKNITLPDDISAPGIIINNAGYFLLKHLYETSYEEYINQIKINLFTAVNVINRFLGDLKKNERGLIVNVCSSGALDGRPESGAYASSKHALLGYTRSLREELIDTEIGVTALNLGQTESTSWEGSSIDRNKLVDPKDVADLLVAISTLSPRSVIEELILKPQHGRVPPM